MCLLLAGCASPAVAPRGSAAPPPPAVDVEPVGGLGLFRGERRQTQELLAKAVQARGFDVVPLEVSARAWANAAEGRHPLTGAACGMPMPSWTARERWGSTLGLDGHATGHVWCEDDGGCTLSVTVRALSGPPRAQWEAPLERTGEVMQSLGTAMTKLAPPPPDEGMGGLGLGSLGGSQPIQKEDLLEVSVYGADARSRRSLEREAQQRAFPGLSVALVLACLPPLSDSVSVLAEVDGAGRVVRCEGESDVERSEATCACGQLQRVSAAPALENARWDVHLRVDRRDLLTADQRLMLTGYWNTYLDQVKDPGEQRPHFKVKVQDPSLEHWTPGSWRLAAGCFTSAFDGPKRLGSRWAVWFDGFGRPVKAVEQKGYPPLPPEVSTCVQRALMTAQAPCPARAGLWAMADFSVNARDPAAPVENPFGPRGLSSKPDAGVPPQAP